MDFLENHKQENNLYDDVTTNSLYLCSMGDVQINLMKRCGAKILWLRHVESDI